MGINQISLCSGDVQHTVGKLSTRATTLLQTSLQSEVCTRSYAPSKLQESQLLQFRDSHLGVPRQNGHLDVVPVEWRKVYYKGEGGGFPQVWAVVSLVCPNCPRFVLTPKMLQLCTNHLVLVLCKSVWVNKLVTSSKSHLGASTCPSTPL